MHEPKVRCESIWLDSASSWIPRLVPAGRIHHGLSLHIVLDSCCYVRIQVCVWTHRIRYWLYIHVCLSENAVCVCVIRLALITIDPRCRRCCGKQVLWHCSIQLLEQMDHCLALCREGQNLDQLAWMKMYTDMYVCVVVVIAGRQSQG